MQLKISNITNLTDARFFSAIGAHYLGFCFDALNENNISITKAKEIISWLHEPAIVGEFGHHQSIEEIEFIAKEMQLHEIQIPFSHHEKANFNVEKFLLLDDWSMLDTQDSTDYYVLKITEAEVQDPALKNVIGSNKVFLETDFNKENILSIVETLQPYGIQITCKKEEKTGFSFVDEYAELLEIIGFS